MTNHTHTAHSMFRNVERRKDNVLKRWRATIRYGFGRRWRGPWRHTADQAVADAQAFRHFRDTGALYKLRGL